MFEKRSKQLYISDHGQPLLQLPMGRKEAANVPKRQVTNFGQVSGAELLSRTGFDKYRTVLYLGPFSQAYSLVKKYRGEDGVTLVTVKRNLAEFRFDTYFPEYSEERVPETIPSGRGIFCLSWNDIPELRKKLVDWPSHSFILLPGGGITITEELLNCFYGHRLFIVTEMLNEGLGKDFSAEDVFRKMRGIIIGSAGSVSNEIQTIIRKYDATMADTVMGMGYNPVPHTESRKNKKDKSKIKRHLGMNLTQTYRTMEKPVLSQGEVNDENRRHKMICIDLFRPEGNIYVAGPVF